MRLFIHSFRLVALFSTVFAIAACSQAGTAFAPVAGSALASAAQPNATGATVIYRFKGGSNLGDPTGGVTPYGSALYGTASINGTGMVYEATKSGATWAVKKIYAFTSSADGAAPYGIIAAANGTFFGATGEGGTYSYGTVYKLAKSGNSYKHTILHSMSSTDGNEPGLLAMDKAGAIYGVTSYGGKGGKLCGTIGCGVVYELTPSHGGTYSYKVLYNFKAGTDGVNPSGRLAIAANGALYGVTIAGGPTTKECQEGCGTIFALTKSGNAYQHKTLYRFRGGADGTYPIGGVAFGRTAATSSTLFGVTSGGGDVGECYNQQSLPGCGTVFAFAGGKKTTLYAFRGYSYNDGETPTAGVTATSTGLLGSTSLGGDQTTSNSVGTIWSIAYAGTGYKILHNFNGVAYGTDGRAPDSPIAPSGSVYFTSMLQGGGSKACGFYGCGVIVELTR